MGELMILLVEARVEVAFEAASRWWMALSILSAMKKEVEGGGGKPIPSPAAREAGVGW